MNYFAHKNAFVTILHITDLKSIRFLMYYYLSWKYTIKVRPGDITKVAESLVRALTLGPIRVSRLLQLLDLLEGHAHTVPHELSTGAQHRQALLTTLSTVSTKKSSIQVSNKHQCIYSRYLNCTWTEQWAVLRQSSETAGCEESCWMACGPFPLSPAGSQTPYDSAWTAPGLLQYGFYCTTQSSMLNRNRHRFQRTFTDASVHTCNWQWGSCTPWEPRSLP